MENKEEIEVDIVGVEKQRKEAILNSGKYAHISVVVGENFKEPVVQADIKGNPFMLAAAIASLRQVDKTLTKRADPLTRLLIEEFMENMTSTTFEVE